MDPEKQRAKAEKDKKRKRDERTRAKQEMNPEEQKERAEKDKKRMREGRARAKQEMDPEEQKKRAEKDKKRMREGRTRAKQDMNPEEQRERREKNKKRMREARARAKQEMDPEEQRTKDTHIKKRKKLNEARKNKIRNQVVKMKTYKQFIELGKRYAEDVVTYEHLSKMIPCRRGCGAFHFPCEETEGKCCKGEGHGSFEKLHPIEPLILDGLQHNKNFRENLRFYNTSFQMATLGSTMGGSFSAPNSFPFFVKFSGGIYHSLPPVFPKTNEKPRFLQIYMLDTKKRSI